MKKIIFLLSLFFVFLSFFPTLYEIQKAKNLSKERAFELVHNYVFDYNFYLSRIREGQPAFSANWRIRRGEGSWLVTEKYYNQPHDGSLLQIFYLYLGKAGGLFGLTPPAIYHGARVILGLILLLVIGKLVSNIFDGWPASTCGNVSTRGGWSVIAFLFAVTAGSWPIVVKLGDGFRFSTHWGGWSAIDSLLRITFIPHVLAGQIFLVLFIMTFSEKSLKLLKSLRWGALGLAVGIVFPPMLIVVYTIFLVITLLEFILIPYVIARSEATRQSLSYAKQNILPRIVFIIFSLPALLYLQVMFKVLPWSALALFDIQHRSILPYAEYALALGPMLPLGIAGLILALVNREKKFFPFVSWVLTLGALFAVFEHVPQQSPTRFTQMLITVPLGILATYFFYSLWHIYDKYKRSHAFVIKVGIGSMVAVIILMGMGVMFSMLGWKTDEVRGKQAGTWAYPVGVQLVYPLKDFMDGINFLKNNTKTSDVVLAYEAAGNYIPAYAGNFVYLGHANTPDEDNKLKIAAGFFKGEMTADEAKNFLIKENIKYIFFGPQEREIGNTINLLLVYPFLTSIYTNSRVTIYK